MEIQSEENVVMRRNFADRLNVALEATKQTVANLNEALIAKIKPRNESSVAEDARRARS